MRNRAVLKYSVYGYSNPLPSVQTVLGFNGECIDTATGYYPLGKGYRMYAPQIMRFLSPDELSPFADGGLNTYVYCNGDPVGKIDPTGRIPVFLKPLNSLWKGFKNRYLGRTPKSDRPSTTPAATPKNNTSSQSTNLNNQQTVDPLIQENARSERYFLDQSNRFDRQEFDTIDLTTVPSEIFQQRLALYNSRKERINYITTQYQLEPLNLPNHGSPNPYLVVNSVSATRHT